MAERLGFVIYVAGCLTAGLLAIAAVLVFIFGETGDTKFIAGVGVFFAVVMWLIGRAEKYVLAGM